MGFGIDLGSSSSSPVYQMCILRQRKITQLGFGWGCFHNEQPHTELEKHSSLGPEYLSQAPSQHTGPSLIVSIQHPPSQLRL